MIRSINRVGGAAFAMIVDGEWHNTAKRAAMALAAKIKKERPRRGSNAQPTDSKS